MLLSVCGTDGTSLSTSMQEILGTHKKHLTPPCEGFMGKHTPRLEPLSTEPLIQANQCSMSILLLFSSPYVFCSAISLISVKSVQDGAAAVQKQRRHLPGEGALHGEGSTWKTSSPQSIWYCTHVHCILSAWFINE